LILLQHSQTWSSTSPVD